MNFYEYGEVHIFKNGRNETREDNCLLDGRLQEVFCCPCFRPGENYTGCWDVCATYSTCEGGSCVNGKCVGDPCVDSDGKDFYTKGTSTGFLDDEWITIEDYCETEGYQAGKTVDFTCNTDRTLQKWWFPCEDGESCVDGACIESCDDNDNDGYTTCDDDCNDNNASINPGRSDDCDGVDLDCDGQALADACLCQNGDDRSCGPQNELGICQYGTSYCNNGFWGSCTFLRRSLRVWITSLDTTRLTSSSSSKISGVMTSRMEGTSALAVAVRFSSSRQAISPRISPCRVKAIFRSSSFTWR